MLTRRALSCVQASNNEPSRACEAAEAVAAEAVRLWAGGGETRRDDITVVVLMFESMTRAEAESEQLLAEQAEAEDGSLLMPQRDVS